MSISPRNKPKIETVNIDELTLREGNPNEMSDEQLDSLEYSMERFGYIQPIIVDQHNIIVDGAHRYKSLKRDPLNGKIDIIRVRLKDDNERRLLSQTLNKLRGQHDVAKDITELEILMGYNPIELQSLLSFDETGLDLLRQQVAEEQNEKEQVEFEATRYPNRKELLNREDHTKTQCPSCGHIF